VTAHNQTATSRLNIRQRGGTTARPKHISNPPRINTKKLVTGFIPKIDKPSSRNTRAQGLINSSGIRNLQAMIKVFQISQEFDQGAGGCGTIDQLWVKKPSCLRPDPTWLWISKSFLQEHEADTNVPGLKPPG